MLSNEFSYKFQVISKENYEIYKVFDLVLKPLNSLSNEGSYQNLQNYLLLFYFYCRNSSVAMGASLSSSEYSLKVTDVTKVRTLNAIAQNSLV